MLTKRDFPLLEYDPSPRAVLEPGHDAPGLRLPENCAFPFLGDTVHDYAREHALPVLGECVTITKRYPVYLVSDEVCLCEAPIGAPVAAGLMDWMIAYGARQFISAGSCGALIDLPENTLIVPRRALRWRRRKRSLFISLTERIGMTAGFSSGFSSGSGGVICSWRKASRSSSSSSAFW